MEIAGNKKPASQNPRDRKARDCITVALLQSISKVRLQNTMKDHRKTLHEFITHIIKEPTERNKRRRAANKRRHASITGGTQSSGVNNAHARKVANGNRDGNAINHLL
jgi:phage protein D